MIIEVSNHRYFITDAGDENYNVIIYREMRLTPYEGMKQPTPVGAILGWDTVMRVLYKGKPAYNHTFKLGLQGEMIQSGHFNHDGMFYGLMISMNESCECIPFDCIKNESRLCDKELDLYEVYLEEPQEGPSLAS